MTDLSLVVQCSERNLAGIKQKYEAEYGKSLHKAISVYQAWLAAGSLWY